MSSWDGTRKKHIAKESRHGEAGNHRVPGARGTAQGGVSGREAGAWRSPSFRPLEASRPLSRASPRRAAAAERWPRVALPPSPQDVLSRPLSPHSRAAVRSRRSPDQHGPSRSPGPRGSDLTPVLLPESAEPCHRSLPAFQWASISRHSRRWGREVPFLDLCFAFDFVFP